MWSKKVSIQRMDPLLFKAILKVRQLMIISLQRTPKCAHLDSSLRRQKTNKISRVPVVHIKSGARNVFGRRKETERKRQQLFSSAGGKKKSRSLSLFLVFLCAPYFGRDFFPPRLCCVERPDWPSFFSLTLMLVQNAGHSSQSALSPCCRYPRVLRADATRRHQIHSTEDCRNHSHRQQMGSDGRLWTAPLRGEFCDNRVTRASLTEL